MSQITVLLLLHPWFLGQGDGRALPELEVGGLTPFRATGIVLEKEGGSKVAGPLIFSPDGKRLAAGYIYAKTTTLKDFKPEPPKRVSIFQTAVAVRRIDDPAVIFRTPEGMGMDVQMKSMTNQFLWTVGREDRKMRLWDVEKGVLVKDWDDHHSLTAVAVAPQEDAFATAYRSVFLYRLPAGTRELLYDPEDEVAGPRFKHLHFSADGKRLIAFAHRDKIVAIEVATKRAAATAEGKFAIGNVSVGAAGRLIATGEMSYEPGQIDRMNRSFIRLRDANTLQMIRSVQPFKSQVFSVGLSRDERYLIAAGCDDFDGFQRAFRIWDLQSGKQVAGYRIEKFAGGIALAISRTDRVALLLGIGEPMAVFDLADLIREGRADK